MILFPVIYNGNSGSRTWDVGSKPGGISWVGAYDLSGNVWEWVNDWYSPTYYQDCVDEKIVENPSGPDAGTSRGMRGGSWYDLKDSLRVSKRGDYAPGLDNANLGFRCARGGAYGP